jgi:hypothetical protein
MAPQERGIIPSRLLKTAKSLQQPCTLQEARAVEDVVGDTVNAIKAIVNARRLVGARTVQSRALRHERRCPRTHRRAAAGQLPVLTLVNVR